MLSYRCSNECRHCLYRCGPRQPDEWMTIETAEKVLQKLALERSLHGVHLAGGEPFLKPDLLEEIIRLSGSYGVPVDYVETNAFWAASVDKAHTMLGRMRDAGLAGLLVSASMFHNEFIPFERTQNCIDAAVDVFGPGGVIVWTPQTCELIARLPDPDRTHSLEEFCRLTGLSPDSPQLPRLYGLTPGGRVPDALRNCYTAVPAETFEGDACRRELLSTSHFHIDHLGNLFTGLCAGIAPGDADDLHPAISGDTFPAFRQLCDEGPFGLMQTAAGEAGYEPKDGGYISKCDLCFDVRRALLATGRFPELRPANYYDS
jgi:hypothetical protein